MSQLHTTLTQTMAGRSTARLNDLNWRIRRLANQYAAETDPATRKALKAIGARLVKERDEIRGGK